MLKHWKYLAASVATASILQFNAIGFAAAAETSTASPLRPQAANPNPAPPTGPVYELLPSPSASVFKSLTPSSAASGLSGESTHPDAVPPPNHGTGFAPYTHARVAVQVLGPGGNIANTPVTSYPYRPTGKLYFQISGSTYVCTASMIKPGVLITAAHCVFNFGQGASGWYSGWTFCPALTSAGQPYGCFAAGSARILTTYYNGTDVCTQTGVVCNDDMATLTLSPDTSGVLPGRKTGWYTYGWNGYSYAAFSTFGNANVAAITQLGYPQAIDSGLQMQRTDATGWKVVSGSLLNTEIGSAQTGGSSGGPWMVNFGTPPVFGSGSSSGATPARDVIVGVTSWGFIDTGVQIQGASFFGQNSQYTGNYSPYGLGNIGLLMHDTCTANPTLC